MLITLNYVKKAFVTFTLIGFVSDFTKNNLYLLCIFPPAVLVNHNLRLGLNYLCEIMILH